MAELKLKRNHFLTLTIITITLLVLTAHYPTLNVKAQNTNQDGQLTITGLVSTPQNLTLADLMTFPQTTEYAVLYCVDFPNSPVTAGNWTGVKLSDLLAAANVSENATKVAFFAFDGFTTDLTIQRAMEENVLVAYQKDGEFLTENLRLVTPGNWGYKWIAELTRIQLVDYNYLGYWESRGYTDQASVTESPQPNPATAYQPAWPSATPAITSPSPSSTASTPTSSPSPTPKPTSTQPQNTPTSTPSQTNASPTPDAAPTATPSADLKAPENNQATPQTLSIIEIIGVVTIAAVLVAAVSVILVRKRHVKE